MSSNTLWAATLVAVSTLAVSTMAAPQPEIWKDPGAATERRANDLLPRMTLEEKVSQMMNDSPAIPRLNIPAYNWWNESLRGVARARVLRLYSPRQSDSRPCGIPIRCSGLLRRSRTKRAPNTMIPSAAGNATSTRA